MQGSTGVIVPPKGYLQRLREICTRYGILLIFDEVITGFGRLGTPFAADFFAVRPDMITFAKAVNNAAVPLGGVIVDQAIHDAFMTGPDHLIEFFHGYTYSGHPLAVAAAHAALDLLPTALPHAASLSPVLEDCVHSLRGEPLVTDIRNLGLAAAIDVAPVPGMPALRAFQVFEQALQRGLMLRFTGETLAMAPPFISTIDEIKEMTETLREALRATAALG
jgi:beta-alanine--pyruvate transaminase